MLYGQKLPVNGPKKKNDKGKTFGKNIKVIKHFQPKIIYHNSILEQTNFPEVNSDIDIAQKLGKIKTVESYSEKTSNPSKRAKNTNRKKPHTLRNNVVEKSQVKNPPSVSPEKNIQILFSPLKSSFYHNKLKSKSYVEERCSVRDDNETKKSKSFIAVTPNITKKNIFSSDSSSSSSDNNPSNSFKETSLDRIKKELIINRIEGLRTFSTCSDRKEKIQNLRTEISLLINPQCEDKSINDFKPTHMNYLIYNVNEEQNKRSEEKVLPTFSTNNDQNVKLKQRGRHEEKETQSSEVSTPRATDDGPTEKSTCSCLTSEESIRQKIHTANMLISRVQETLNIIKMKQQPIKKNLDDNTDTEKDFVSSELEEAKPPVEIEEGGELPFDELQTSEIFNVQTSDLENSDSDAFEKERPKTRRKGDERFIPEKYRTFPKDLIEPDNSEFEIIKNKLNTISESSEISDCKASESHNDNAKSNEVSVVNVSVNTENIAREEQSIQVLPESSSVATQAQSDMMCKHVQTDNLTPKAHSATETESVKKSSKLVVQVLPQINIAGTLFVERILDFSINQMGTTELIYKTDNPNVGFIEYSPSEASVVNIESVDYDLEEKRPTLVNVRRSIRALNLVNSDMTQSDSGLRLHSSGSHRRIKSSETSDSRIKTQSELDDSHTARLTKSETFSFIRRCKDRQKAERWKYAKNLSSNKLLSADEQLVLESYHVIDNTGRHDPEALPERDLIHDIDESVYKTFINPKGLPQRNHSISFPATEPPSVKEQVETNEEPKSPKLFNIGLYDTKDTQIPSAPPSEKEYFPDDYEKVSFSLTISTETSDEEIADQFSTPEKTATNTSFVPSMESKNVLKQLREKLGQEHPRVSENSDILNVIPEKDPSEELLVPEFVGEITSQTPHSLQKIIPFIRKNVKLRSSVPLRKNKESYMQTDEFISNQNSPSESEMVPKTKDAVESTVNLERDEFEKESPRRKEVESSAPGQTVSHQTTTLNSSTPENKSDKNNCAAMGIRGCNKNVNERTSKDDDDERTSDSNTSAGKKHSKEYTVMRVQVQGDCVPTINPREYINALKLAKNGRYKDEANLFCENNYPEYSSCYSPRKMQYKFPLDSKDIVMDSSNSETNTSRKLSEGEVRCQSSLSNGEIYKWGNIMEAKQKNILMQKKKKRYAYKKRTYFNNWVTYYVNNDNGVNDSSVSSSK